MDDSGNIKSQDIVNFENLHSNIALESSQSNNGEAGSQSDGLEIRGGCKDSIPKEKIAEDLTNGNTAGGLNVPDDNTVSQLPNTEENNAEKWNLKNDEDINNSDERESNPVQEVTQDAEDGTKEQSGDTELKEDGQSPSGKYTASETSASVHDVMKMACSEGDQAEDLKKIDGNGDRDDLDIEEVARDIIKNALNGATEQVLKVNTSKDESSTGVDGKGDKKDEWLDILGNGLLMKKILQTGEGPDTRPIREKEVVIKYEARLKNGKEIVESDNSLSFVLAEQDVLAVFDLAVALMQKGEIAIVESSARYAYGEEGCPPKIPSSADLIFEIELLEVRDGPFSENVDLDKRLMWADEKRLKGNKFYSGKRYAEAATAYTRAIKSLESGWMYESSNEARSRINEMRLKCYNNLTATQMKLEKWKDSFQTCRAAEKLDPNNLKTLFRKGRIHCELGDLEKGVSALSKAAALEPDNKSVAIELAKQTRKLEKQKEAQKKMYRRMLGTKSNTLLTTVSAKKTKEIQQKPWFQNWGRVVGSTLAIGAVLVGMYIAHRS